MALHGQLRASTSRMARQVLEAAGWSEAGEQPVGVDHVLGLAVGPGGGEPDETATTISLGRAMSGDIMTDIRAIGSSLRSLPTEVRQAVDDWDPDGRAGAIVPFTMSQGAIAGRSTFGARAPSWESLEDKLAIVEVWSAAGVDQAPAIVTAADDAPGLAKAFDDLSSERGVVVAADNNKGWHGGATGTHWIRSAADLDGLSGRLSGHDRVRVMPFLIGTPCSIHGMVLPNRTVAFRPCEMMVFVDEQAGSFSYGQVSTFWNPDEQAAEAMREAARKLGEELRRRVGFRGVFTLDGVLTVDGFLPTEVNPRYGAALPNVFTSMNGPNINLYLLHLAVVEAQMTIDADKFERWVRAGMAERRNARSMTPTTRFPARGPARRARVDVDGDELVLVESAGEGEPLPERPTEGLAAVEWAAEGSGGRLFVRMTEQTPVGPETAPLVARIFALVDEHWQVGMPSLVAAAPNRSGR